MKLCFAQEKCILQNIVYVLAKYICSVLKSSHCFFMNAAQISRHIFETYHGVVGPSTNALQP